MIFAPALRPGDPVAVVAPSGAFDGAGVRLGIRWLEERYRVVRRPAPAPRLGYLAAADRTRFSDLQRALDADVRAVIAVRGGYGLSRIAHLLDWTKARKRPRWLVGFSDLTVLHVEAWRRGMASIHGAMVGSLGRASEAARAQWMMTLENPKQERLWRGLVGWRRGVGTGTLVGGNLAILHACAAASRLRIPTGAVVLLEDIAERPYRVDRMLTNLMTGGHLSRASAIVVGRFVDCKAGPDGRRVEEVLRERLSSLGVPIVAHFPSGHARRNDAVVLGMRAEINAERGTCRLFP